MLNQDGPEPGSVAELERAVAELRQAQLADARRRKAELAADVQRSRDADRERAEELRRSEEAQRGGPCRYCGVEFSRERGRDGVVRTRWYANGACCAWCQEDRDWIGGFGTDSDHRGRALVALLDPEVLSDWRMPYLLDRTDFKWWYETPGAAPGGRARFAYADVAALAERLRPAEEPPLQGGDPCPRCGCAYMWVKHADDPQTRCRGCSAFVDRVLGNSTFSNDVYLPAFRLSGLFDVAERLIGLSYVEAQRAINGGQLGWYEHLPENDPRRKFTLAPFAYLGDVAALKVQLGAGR